MKSGSTGGIIPDSLAQSIDICVCPVCSGALKVESDKGSIRCLKCNQSYGCDDGIPLLFWPNEWDSQTDVTDVIKSFYEQNPFPGYEDIDSDQSLRQKAEKGIFARTLDDQIPYGVKILEVGCGTGQLSNYLGMTWGRTVFATDICLNSLKLGQEFKQRSGINNVTFLQMNLFRPVFRPESFDLVICNGVLHHTGNPFSGLKSLINLVKVGGYIIIGLYNTFGRIPTDVRRYIFRFTGNRLKSLDPRLRDRNLADFRKHIWFMDQYKNPHESKHTIGEVLDWFEHTDITFINGIPKPTAFTQFYPNENLFEQNQRGNKFDHFLVQLGMLLSGGSEGGFFIMIGRKKS